MEGDTLAESIMPDGVFLVVRTVELETVWGNRTVAVYYLWRSLSWREGARVLSTLVSDGEGWWFEAGHLLFFLSEWES